MQDGDVMAWLETWYVSQCDGDWEHEWGIRIDTADNPGWSVDIDLEHTELEERSFTEVNVANGGNDWMICRISDKVFAGRGGPRHLTTILQVFRDWVEQEY